jgi:hypothetical protein
LFNLQGTPASLEALCYFSTSEAFCQELFSGFSNLCKLSNRLQKAYLAARFRKALDYLITTSRPCQALFLIFQIFFGALRFFPVISRPVS